MGIESICVCAICGQPANIVANVKNIGQALLGSPFRRIGKYKDGERAYAHEHCLAKKAMESKQISINGSRITHIKE